MKSKYITDFVLYKKDRMIERGIETKEKQFRYKSEKKMYEYGYIDN